MSNSPKKVLVRRFAGDTLPGYLPQSAFVRHNSIDLLDLSGRLISLSLNDIKTISYVRDFNLSDPVNPERLTRRTFLARPRTEGLWLRLTFRSGDLLEGLAPTDRSLLDALADDDGLFLTPPDTRSNTQRLYVPRSALTEVQLLAVITTPSRRQPRPDTPEPIQDELFHLPLDPTSRPN
ncbi:MAG TPA: hypothetical protein VMQ60_02455 [Acidobacteriaceae bacterium]|jgi:hypothetical protein|nr:hypothetical protein [Acidobacteriaceae bacterium]